MPARPAGGNDNLVDRAQFCDTEIQSAKLGRAFIMIDAAAKGVFDGPRLLKNFFEHVMREVAAFSCLCIEFELADLDFGGVRPKVRDVEAVASQCDHVVIVQIDDLARM